MKTMLEWFKTVKNPIIRKKLIAELKTKTQQNRCEDSLVSAIGGAFEWAETKDKYDYWCVIHSLAVKGKLSTI